MLTLKNIPKEIYFTACEYERIEIKEDELDRAKEIYDYETTKRGYVDGGFEKAVYDYMTLQNNFNEDEGIFAGINGYSIEN